MHTGGSDLHLQSPTTAWNATGTAPQQPNTSPPPFGATTAVKSIHSSSPNSTAPSPPFSFVSGTFQPQTTPAAVGLVPSSGIISPTIPGPIPCESPNQGAPSSTSKQQRHQQQPQQQQQFPITTPPVASAAPVATASKSATRKRRATEDPEGAPNSHNPPKHPLLSSMLSTQSYQPASSVPAAASAEIPSFSFAKSAAPAPGTSAAEAPTRAAKRSSGQPTGGGSGSGAGGSGAAVAIPKPPLFGSLFSGSGGAASNAAVSGGAAAASSAATAGDPAASKPFAALFGNSVAGVFLPPLSVVAYFPYSLGHACCSSSIVFWTLFGMLTSQRVVRMRFVSMCNVTSSYTGLQEQGLPASRCLEPQTQQTQAVPALAVVVVALEGCLEAQVRADPVCNVCILESVLCSSRAVAALNFLPPQRDYL